MKAISGQSCYPTEAPPVFISGDSGNIIKAGQDGYFYARGDKVVTCSSSECQIEAKEYLQPGDIVIRTDLRKSYKYSLDADNILVYKELVSGTDHQVFSQLNDPAEDSAVNAGDFWFKEDLGKLYFRYSDNFDGDLPDEGCDLDAIKMDQWIDIAGELAVDINEISDNIYHVNDVYEIDFLSGTKKGDICIVDNDRSTFKHINDQVGLDNWVEIAASSNTTVVYSETEMLNLSNVGHSDLSIVTSSNKTYKNINGINNSMDDWQELLAEGRYKLYAQMTDPSLEQDVKPLELWLNTYTGTTYIRYDDEGSSGQWISLVGEYQERGTTEVFFSDTDPSDNSDLTVMLKDLWFNTAQGITYIRYPDTTYGIDQWVALTTDTITAADETYKVNTLEEMYDLDTKKGDVVVVTGDGTYKNIYTPPIYSPEDEVTIQVIIPEIDKWIKIAGAQ